MLIEGVLAGEVLVSKHSGSKAPEAKHTRPEPGESSFVYQQLVRHSSSLAAAASPRPWRLYRMPPTFLLPQQGAESKKSTLLLTGELLLLRQTLSEEQVFGGDGRLRSKVASSCAQAPMVEILMMLIQTPLCPNSLEHPNSGGIPEILTLVFIMFYLEIFQLTKSGFKKESWQKESEGPHGRAVVLGLAAVSGMASQVFSAVYKCSFHINIKHADE